MLNRSAVGNTTRPPQPQRSLSGTSQQHVHRPNHPSRLSNVRSASGLGQYVDLTVDATDARNAEVWQQNRERVGLGGVLEPITVSDDVEDTRPRKKAKLEADGALVGSPEQHEGGSIAQYRAEDAHSKMPGQMLDFPPRSSATAIRGPRRKAANDPARKSDGIYPPAMATRLPAPRIVADFSPWTGLHPEDILNEQVIKTGYFDKPPGTSQNESNSARPSIWPNLSQKNNIALQTLSHLFTQVLDKRQGLAKCTAPSTFKPPPRVTVTDTKREAWLKDLANTNIPLRRQSRTIPHGIRGKLLMEQCLAKSIPLQRAVWLAKCVGANELRSFRRKGVSGSAAAQGETKWVRDWTVQVEQFLESIANACGQENWRTKIDYAIKLASAFYSEGLLDRDEYLDWLVRTFTSASLDKLPLWMIIVQIYWKDLTTYGRRGRKLASAILEHLEIVSDKKHAAFEPLKARLQKLITIMAASTKGCLVLPKVWKRHCKLLSMEQLPTPSHDLQLAVSDVVRRNERLSAPMERNVENTRSPLLGLYTILDGVDLNIDMDALSARCRETIPDTRELVRAVLHWSSSLYRRGRVRVYIAAKVIACLHASGDDTNGAVLAYLERPNSATPPEAEQVWAVIGELVRRDCFATGAYLQWLIASGALYEPDKFSLATGLLASLPMEKMPQRLRNLRKTLLGRLGQTNNEESAIHLAKAEIELAMANSKLRFNDYSGTIASLSGSAALAVSDWICDRAMSVAKDSSLPITVFTLLRGLLEGFGDMSALTSLIEIALQTEDTGLLASIADTVNTHALDLAVLGSFTEALEHLISRHRALRSHTLDRSFILALSSLAKRCPEKASFVKLLQNDLTAYEQQHSAAVCSPASDNVVGMQAGSLDSDSEIDAVFASGNSMDEQTMQRVFLRVMERAVKMGKEVVGFESNVSRWSNQLRTVDSAGFEKLARDYISATVLKSQVDPAATSGVVALAASRCLGLEAITAPGIPPSSKAAAAVLNICSAPMPATSLSASEEYTFRLQQQLFCDGHPDEIASLLRKAGEDPTFSFEADWVLSLIVRTITGHTGKLRRAFTENQPSQTVQQGAARICKALLSQGQASSVAAEMDPCHVIRSANALNAPFVIGWLRFFTSSQAAAGNEEAIRSALFKAVAEKSEVWPQLLSAAKPETLREVHAWARTRILAGINAAQGTEESEAAAKLCEVLDVTYDSVKTEDDTPVIALLADKIKAQEKQLSELDTTKADCQTKLAAISRAIRTLLHFCTLSSQNPPTSDTAKHTRSLLLAALSNLLSNPRLQTQGPLASHIHDVAALHADSLPEETLSTLARQTPSTNTNTHVLSLLGSFNTAAATALPALALASRTQPPQTQQQRALARRPPPGSANAAAQPRGQPPAVVERKLMPFPMRNWEVMPDSTPVMGENDCAVSLGLFGARRV